VTGESTEGCIVLTDLSKSYVSSSSSTAQLNQSEDRQCIMNYRVNQATGSTIPYMYNPLTPPWNWNIVQYIFFSQIESHQTAFKTWNVTSIYCPKRHVRCFYLMFVYTWISRGNSDDEDDLKKKVENCIDNNRISSHVPLRCKISLLMVAFLLVY
jgi:hypothetical protein